MKLLITPRSYGKFNKAIIERLNHAGFEVIREIGPLEKARMKTLIKDVDALIVGTDHLDEDIIDHAENLKIISKYGTGLDNIPKAYAESKGIQVKNIPSVNNEAVADYTFGLLLATARDIALSAQELKNGKWSKHVGVEIYNKKLGIIGFGSIGKAVAQRAKGFNMDIAVYDLYEDHEAAKRYGARFVSFDQLISESHFITIHVPLLPETTDLIDYKQMQKMKKDAIIINTARGGIVNEPDLYKALKEGKIRGAGIDVFQVEPPISSPLLSLDNALLTQHNAASSEEAVRNMTMKATKNVLDFFGMGHIHLEV